MERTKDLFLMMQEQEVSTSNFLPTKKELKLSAEQFANNLIENGEHNPQELYAQSLRLKEALVIIESILKKSLPDENFEAFGLNGTYRNGGDTINYTDDLIYSNLKNQLDDRAELLKLAVKTNCEFYDSEGELVEKVSTTPRKSSLAISF